MRRLNGASIENSGMSGFEAEVLESCSTLLPALAAICRLKNRAYTQPHRSVVCSKAFTIRLSLFSSQLGA
jgi:hypothetical protein